MTKEILEFHAHYCERGAPCEDGSLFPLASGYYTLDQFGRAWTTSDDSLRFYRLVDCQLACMSLSEGGFTVEQLEKMSDEEFTKIATSQFPW